MKQRRIPPSVIGGGGYRPSDPRRRRKDRRPGYGARVIRGLMWWITEIEAAMRGGWYQKFPDAETREDAQRGLDWLRKFTIWAGAPYGENLTRRWREKRDEQMDAQGDE